MAVAAAIGKDIRIHVSPSFMAQHPSRIVFIHTNSPEEAGKATSALLELDVGNIADIRVYGGITPSARDCAVCGMQHKSSKKCPVGRSLASKHQTALGKNKQKESAQS